MKNRMRFFLFALAFLAVFGLDGAYSPASAKHHVAKHISPQYNPKYAAFVVDGDTGKILYQENAGELRYPASLTKMMTLYILFEALESRKVKMDTVLTASAYAAGRPKTNLSMQPGQTITVGDALLAIIVKSANDAATIVGEALGGTEQNFAKMMNAHAKILGMKNTHFENACGLPDPQQVTTAKDMALLGIALKKHFPQYFPFFSRREFTYNGVNYKGHNHVMEEYPGADGLKTGFVNASGYNLVTTATRRGINLVGVVLGGRTHQSRDQQMMKLLDDGFEKAAAIKNMTYVATDYKANEAKSDDDDEEAAPEDVTTPPPIGAVVNSNSNLGLNPAPTSGVTQPVNSNAVNARSAVINKVVAGGGDADEPGAVQKAPAAIDESEQQTVPKKFRQVVQTNSDDDDVPDNFDAKPLRSAASSGVASKAQRYKSNMVIEQTPLSATPSEPLFVPTPKDKPQL